MTGFFVYNWQQDYEKNFLCSLFLCTHDIDEVGVQNLNYYRVIEIQTNNFILISYGNISANWKFESFPRSISNLPIIFHTDLGSRAEEKQARPTPSSFFFLSISRNKKLTADFKNNPLFSHRLCKGIQNRFGPTTSYHFLRQRNLML